MKSIGLRVFVLTVFLLSTFAGVSLAGVRAGAFTISPMGGGYSFDDEQDLLDLGKTFTLGLGYNFTDSLAAELGLTYIHTDADGTFSDEDVYVHQPRIDLLYHIMPDKMLVPYIAAGVGGMFFNDDNVDPPQELDDMVQANAGGGLKLFVTDNVALRADGRYYYGFEDSQSEYAVTIGMVFQLGGEQAPKPCIDSDNDGVCDDEDQCPDTPAGVRVDSVGCQIKSEPYAEMEKSGETGQAVGESDVVVVEDAIEMMEVVVYFDFDESNIKPLYFERLADLAAFMDENPEIVAVVEGHTDSVGTDSYNMDLSKRRAEAVKNYVVNNHGIDGDRFDLKWFGEERPVAPNDSPSNRQLNRRAITITVME